MKNSLLISAAIALAAPGCATTPPKPSEANRFGLEVTQQICNIDALAEEKQSSLSVANDSRRSIAAYQNKYGASDEQTGTILLEKLNYYDAEIEASYRFVTQYCGAYMRCLEQNRHDETQCWRLESRWSDAQARFNQLARDIRVIAAKVELARIKAQADKKKGGGRKGHGRCDTINNIFTDCKG